MGGEIKPKEAPKCSLCRNHFGNDAPYFKGHKNLCPFNNQEHIEKCDQGCQKVKVRQISVAKDKKRNYAARKTDDDEIRISPSMKKMRTCAKCRIHGKIVPLKNGHLLTCKHASCECSDCELTNQRRNASNDFTKHYRNQKIIKNENSHYQPMMTNEQNSPDSGYGNEMDDSRSAVAFSPISSEYSPAQITYSPTEMTFSPASRDVESFQAVYTYTAEISQISIPMDIDETDAVFIVEEIFNIVSPEMIESFEENLNVIFIFFCIIFLFSIFFIYLQKPLKPIPVENLASFIVNPDVWIADDIDFNDLC
jgi:DM DNA binding domain